MSSKNILILFGGGGTEHEVSEVSVKNIIDCLSGSNEYQLIPIEISKSGEWTNTRKESFSLGWDKYLVNQTRKEKTLIDFVIPCLHGYPGETGDIQSFFEMIHLPYMGCGPEASRLAFNKISTKLWAEEIGIPTTPSVYLNYEEDEQILKAQNFMKLQGEVVVKASNQGSSVGCYLVQKPEELIPAIKKAFKLSPFVLVEKRLFPREIELSAYEWNGELIISYPGEIVCPSQFYSYEEKYSGESKTYTVTKAQGLTEQQIKTLQDYSRRIFLGLKLRHLSRIDFFLADGQIYLNEVNTFPGLTPISMFPKMMESQNHSFANFLRQLLSQFIA